MEWWLVMLYAVCQPAAEAPLTVMHYLWFPVYKLSVTYKYQVCLLRRWNNEHKIWASHCCVCEDSVLVGYDAVFSAYFQFLQGVIVPSVGSSSLRKVNYDTSGCWQLHVQGHNVTSKIW